MGRNAGTRLGLALSMAVLAGAVASSAAADHGDPHATLQPDTKGCNGVLPSTDGNTDMRLVGGTLYPGGTAIFEITYPLTASSIGKEFTITACAFINGEAALKYLVTFVPSNAAYVLRMTFAIPDDAPVGGTYCNYAKTTQSPTAAQASQRKAGPACFIIRPRPTTAIPPVAGPGSPDDGSSVDVPILLPNTAMPAARGAGAIREHSLPRVIPRDVAR
jgi:hypothetical protein